MCHNYKGEMNILIRFDIRIENYIKYVDKYIGKIILLSRICNENDLPYDIFYFIILLNDLGNISQYQQCKLI